MVDEQVVEDPRYLHQGGKPAVQIWGFYSGNAHNPMTAELANRLIDFFQAPGRYSAFLVGGGDWDWRRNPDPAWQKFYRRFGAYCPWNIGNYTIDESGLKHAATITGPKTSAMRARSGCSGFPSSIPASVGTTSSGRRRAEPDSAPRGRFLWEQFTTLSRLGVDTVYVAMFDEVDEGTAIFKVTSSPPTQGHFVGYEGLPSDWYLRLVGEAARRLHDKQPVPREIPLQP